MLLWGEGAHSDAKHSKPPHTNTLVYLVALPVKQIKRAWEHCRAPGLGGHRAHSHPCTIRANAACKPHPAPAPSHRASAQGSWQCSEAHQEPPENLPAWLSMCQCLGMLSVLIACPKCTLHVCRGGAGWAPNLSGSHSSMQVSIFPLLGMKNISTFVSN